MAVSWKNNGTGTDIPKALLKGVVTGIALTVAGAALMSGLITGEGIRETSIGYCAMGILVISSYIGSWVSMGSAKTKKLMISLLSGLIYYGILLLVNGICFRAGYAGAGVTALTILGGVSASVLIRSRPQKARHSLLRKNYRR